MKRFHIHCQSCEKMIGLIGIQPNGVVRYFDTDGIISSRQRLDKTWGFQCVCGNDSRLAMAEVGIIASAPPTMDELLKLKALFKAKPTKFERDGKKIVCDGFIMEPVA